MSAVIKNIEITISCEECGLAISLPGLQKSGYIHQTGVNSWTYLDVYNFPQGWKRYGSEQSDILKQELYCPCHDKPVPKKRGRPKKIVE